MLIAGRGVTLRAALGDLAMQLLTGALSWAFLMFWLLLLTGYETRHFQHRAAALRQEQQDRLNRPATTAAELRARANALEMETEIQKAEKMALEAEQSAPRNRLIRAWGRWVLAAIAVVWSFAAWIADIRRALRPARVRLGAGASTRC